MKLPEKLVDRMVNRIVDELTKEKVIEAEDIDDFKKKVKGVFKKAEEEERELDERAKEILKEKLSLLEEANLDYRSAFKAVKARLAEEMNININRRERMNQVANMIKNLIMEDETVEIYEDPPLIRRKIIAILREAVREEEDIDREVRDRIKSYSRNILEGTQEWNLLYRKIYEDVLKRRGLY